MRAAEIRRTAFRYADVFNFTFSAQGLGEAAIGCGGEGKYLTSSAISRIVSSMGVSVDTLYRSAALHNRLCYRSAGLPMDVVEVDTVHSEPSERLLTRLANVLPRSGNFHRCSPLYAKLPPPQQASAQDQRQLGRLGYIAQCQTLLPKRSCSGFRCA